MPGLVFWLLIITRMLSIPYRVFLIITRIWNISTILILRIATVHILWISTIHMGSIVAVWGFEGSCHSQVVEDHRAHTRRW